MGLLVAQPYLPTETTCSDLGRSDKYPLQGREGTRTYANASHVHIYGALVAFTLREGRKPKGEEVNKLLHGAWCLYLEASETEDADEDGDEQLDVGVCYALKFGDSVTHETTNTYPVAGFKNATNHGKLVKEVEAARKELVKQNEEMKLLTKWGMVNKQSFDCGAAIIPEADSLIEFRCVKLGKKEVVVWSAKPYEHVNTAAPRGHGRGAGAAPRVERVSKAIALKVSREIWVEMIQKYDGVHETTPNPP
eukprot:7383824-Prymnesium_polylepis.1